MIALKLVTVLVTVLCICMPVLLIRNEWVFRRQKELNRFEGGVHVINGYADYYTMVFKFWIWDVEKFKLPNVEVRGAAPNEQETK